MVTLDTGVQMAYNNTFGGTWYWDPSDPFNVCHSLVQV